MIGRNGHDSLNTFIYALILVLLIVNIFVKNSILSTVAIILLIYSYYRLLSKDIASRSAENKKFLDTINPLLKKFNFSKNAFKNRKEYKYFTCPKCNLAMKAPRGKGKLLITCKKCGEKFHINS